MLSEPAKTVTPAAHEPLHRRHRHGAGPVGHDRDAGFRQRLGGPAKLRIADAAEREGVADRDLAAKPGEFRPPGDLAELRAAERPGIVEMDVDADAVFLRDAEDRVELPLHVVVDAGRIKPADEVGAFPDRGVEKVGDARLDHHAALREGDDLDVEKIAHFLAHLEERVQAVELHLVVDVDMRAERDRAVCDDLLDEAHRARLDRVGQLAPQRLFRRDAFGDAVAGAVRDEGQAEKRLVEMDMPFDKAGKHERALKRDSFDRDPLRAVRCRGPGVSDPRDAPAGDLDVGTAPVGKARVGEDHPRHFISRHAISRTRRAATSL